MNALSFTRDGHYLAAAGYGKVRIYDVFSSANPAVVLSDFTKNINAIGYNDSGSWMFCGGEAKIAKIIDWRVGGLGNGYVTGAYQATSSINSMLLHRNQVEVIFATDKGEVVVWDLRNGRVNSMCPAPRDGPINSVALNADANSLAAVNSAGMLFVWSLAGSNPYKPTEKYRGKVHSSYALKVEFSPDSTLVATCGADTKVNVLKTADFSTMSSLPAGSGHHWVWDCAFSADSRYLLTASSDAVAQLWNLEKNEISLQYKGHSRPITCLAFRDKSLEEAVWANPSPQIPSSRGSNA